MSDTLTIRDSMDDWYVIERAEHDGRVWLERTGPSSSAVRTSARFSDADVEGTREEMLAIAAAIESRSAVSFKRCAVNATTDAVSFRSPRNIRQAGVVSLAVADRLAAEIRRKFGVPACRATYDVYIGRAGHGQDGYFGNPFTVAKHGQAALDMFRDYFAGRLGMDPEFRRRVLELRGKRLGCFCAPRACHGDVIAAWVDSQEGVSR